ncbi:tripartite tricarboxylate transporter permease [Flaviflagellibacter deserti]|uniref:Tripartite tricarboxylate transporter permease n=1 Tax=Flaviflagellibacter deserti TaxID=2267266 RepID=A0ABV9Z333_9HYPH
MDAIITSFELLGTTLIIPMAVIGMTWGIFGGATPGLSPSITMALLLPFTYTMDPIPALVLLTSTYVGAEYGGSIPAILIRTPGTSASAATMIDGYEMRKQGRAGEALGISLQASSIGNFVGILCVILLTAPLSQLALAFKPSSYFALGILGLSVIVSVSEGMLFKGIIGALIGLMIATIGTDPVTGVGRFTYGNADLLTGVPIILVMVGLFAVGEVLEQVANRQPTAHISGGATKLKWPSWAVQLKTAKANLIGSVIGIFSGIMPGAGGTVASFMAYTEARRFSKTPEEFGKGSEEGVAAPECANNADAGVGLIPLLSFGIPASNSTAVLLGGFLIHGLIPGPVLFNRDPTILYGMFSGLLVASLALIPIAYMTLSASIWLVNRPKPYLFAFIAALVFSGAYSINNSPFDLGLVLASGILGYGMRYFGMPMLPTILGLVLGYMIESNYRRSLVISGGDYHIFIEDPVSVIFLSLAVLFLAGSLIREFRNRRLRPQDKEVSA